MTGRLCCEMYGARKEKFLASEVYNVVLSISYIINTIKS